MTKSEVLKLLNNKSGSFQHIVNAVGGYIKSPNVFPRLVNRIVLKAQKQKNLSAMDLFKFFYQEMEGLVKGTKVCPNTYNAQMLLKNVWETLQLQTVVVNQIRRNYAIMQEPEDVEIVKEKPKQKKDPNKKETPEERKERLKVQAEKMRKAKEKKAAEKKAAEAAKRQKETNQKKPQPQQRQQGKQLTKEQQAQVNLLKNLKI